MPTQLENYNKSIEDIYNNFIITKTKLNTDFNLDITNKIDGINFKDDKTGYIKIDDYKTLLKIKKDGTYKDGSDLKALNKIVYTDLVNLETDIDTKIGGLTVSNQADGVNSVYTTNKKDYLINKSFYKTNKDKIHGALMQAKTQNENYNHLVSSSINLICGILIILYLIYKIYTPITIAEIKNTVRTTTETATKVAKQAQSSTNKIVSGK